MNMARPLLPSGMGRAGDAFEHFANAPVANWQDLTRGRPIMVIAPHADDETLGCGGLIALTAAQGVGVTVVVMTDGARAHLNSKKYDAAARRDMREREVRAALDRLGAREVDLVFLRQPDGFLPTEGEAAALLVDKLDDIAAKCGCGSVFVTWGADPHPDHISAYALAMRMNLQPAGIDLYSYPIWALTLDPAERLDVPHAPAFRLEIRSVLADKQAAIACFASQTTQLIDDDRAGICLSAEDVGRCTASFETYIRAGEQTDIVSSVPTAHFEALYSRSQDPWEYGSNLYEQNKFAQTLKALPRNHYDHAVEIGCSIGVLTQILAPLCGTILGIDCAPQAVANARARLAGYAHVQVETLRVPGEVPTGRFDLIVLSEVLYFFSPEDLALTAKFVRERLEPGGTCLLVNFLGDTESPLTGSQAAETFIRLTADVLGVLHTSTPDNYRIDVLEKKREDAP